MSGIDLILADVIVEGEMAQVVMRKTGRALACMSDKNNVGFETAAEAESIGYRWLGDCDK
jgi:hypothetical protein